MSDEGPMTRAEAQTLTDEIRGDIEMLRAMITVAGGIDALPDEDTRHKARLLLGDDS